MVRRTAMPVVVVVMLIGGVANAAVYSLTPVLDGYAPTDPGVFFSAANTAGGAMQVGSGTIYRSALTFDLSAIPNNYVISSAKLWLSISAQSGNMDVDMVHSSVDGWTESPTTGSPADTSIRNVVFGPLGPLLGTNFRQDNTAILFPGWDLLANSAWNYQVDLNDNFLTLVLKEHVESSASSPQHSVGFRTSETTTGAFTGGTLPSGEIVPGGGKGLPHLTIEAAAPPVPEPAAIIVWSLLGGLSLVFAWRRRR